MKRSSIYLPVLLYVVLLFSSCAQDAKQGQLKRPKLVIGIVIDQMRWDYLYRYYDRYSNGGFKRLMNEGYNCQNTFINYIPSYTGPGHACIYTGSIPSIHGIAANDWFDNRTDTTMYCAEDKTVLPVGGSYKNGRMSPHNLLVSTVTDELKLATNMRSRAFGISLKDRASILPAGHLANGAYWFDDSTGNFMSSTYYGKTLPKWLTDFNGRKLADSLIKQKWELSEDKNSYTQSLPDDNPYENKILGEAGPVFPHAVKSTRTDYAGLRYLPGGNSILFAMADACIRGESLGQSAYTDFLCLSFSTPDYVGHAFTSNSMEAEDMYLRLDKELATFLEYLDGQVGKGNYTLFLTADHGAAHNPYYLSDMKMPGLVITNEESVRPVLNDYLSSRFKGGDLVKKLMNYQVYLDEALIQTSGLNRDAIKSAVIEWYKKQFGIAYVVDMENMSTASVPEPIYSMIVNGYNRKRSGCIQLIYEPGWYSGAQSTGTTHGTWNPYDTHIPLLWYGYGVAKGETYETVHMTDIAPTVAALLHIQMPNGCVGKVIDEAIKGKTKTDR